LDITKSDSAQSRNFMFCSSERLVNIPTLLSFFCLFRLQKLCWL
jgi:hypothetical protein